MIQLPINLQHAYKKESTLSLFKRIGKVTNIEELFDELVTSPNVFHYRNKMEYGFSAIGYDRINKTDVDIFTLGFKRNCQNSFYFDWKQNSAGANYLTFIFRR